MAGIDRAGLPIRGPWDCQVEEMSMTQDIEIRTKASHILKPLKPEPYDGDWNDALKRCDILKAHLNWKARMEAARLERVHDSQNHD